MNIFNVYFLMYFFIFYSLFLPVSQIYICQLWPPWTMSHNILYLNKCHHKCHHISLLTLKWLSELIFFQPLALWDDTSRSCRTSLPDVPWRHSRYKGGKCWRQSHFQNQTRDQRWKVKIENCTTTSSSLFTGLYLQLTLRTNKMQIHH